MVMNQQNHDSNNIEIDLPEGGGNWDQSSIDGRPADNSNLTGSNITGLFPRKGKNTRRPNMNKSKHQ